MVSGTTVTSRSLAVSEARSHALSVTMWVCAMDVSRSRAGEGKCAARAQRFAAARWRLTQETAEPLRSRAELRQCRTHQMTRKRAAPLVKTTPTPDTAVTRTV